MIAIIYLRMIIKIILKMVIKHFYSKKYNNVDIKKIITTEYAPKINYSETAIFLDSFFSDIALFLEKNGFTNSQFIKKYSPVEENLKPIMVIEESHSDYKNYKCYTIYITQQTISGGRKSNNYKKKTKNYNKNYNKKTKGKSKKYKKKNNNHINTKRRTRTKRKI